MEAGRTIVTRQHTVTRGTIKGGRRNVKVLNACNVRIFVTTMDTIASIITSKGMVAADARDMRK